MRGIVFDFNGTLYWDTEKHIEAWRIFSTEIRGHALTEHEMKTKVLGRTNADIVRYLLGPQVDEVTIQELGDKKEALYRELCLEDREGLKLAPGVIELFDRLVKNNVPRAIATSSDWNNVEDRKSVV